MTRIIIFSDVHANWEALLSLQQAEARPDAILCLGDTVGYGPDPKLCLDSVRDNAAHIIRGQHDLAVGDNRLHSDARHFDRLSTRLESSQKDDLLEGTWAHTRSMLPDADRDYLASLPTEMTVELSGVRFHLTRFSPDDRDVETQMLVTMPQAKIRELFAHIEADIILLGGPHIASLRQIGGKLIVCPGSLGLPRYGVSDPTFAAWQDGQVKIHHLHYHPDETIRKLSLLPMDPEHILHLQSTLRTGSPD